MLNPNYSGFNLEAGCDEAGRGCLAGPVFAAAVILPVDFYDEILNDSKKLTEKTRLLLREKIEKSAVAYSVASLDNHEIDEINILNASIMAMHKAIKTLSTHPKFLLIDGNHFKSFHEIPYKCIIKGDSKYLSIAAASILAKTYRDEFMMKIHNIHPEYHWDSNKGYPTKLHKDAINKFGITEFHRLSFNLNEQLKMSL